MTWEFVVLFQLARHQVIEVAYNLSALRTLASASHSDVPHKDKLPRRGVVHAPFSPIVLKGVADVVTGGSASDPAPPIGLFRSGPDIEQFMLDCNLDFRIAGGSRVPSLLNFLRNVALPL